MSVLLRTTLALEKCREHVDALKVDDPEIKHYLTQYLLVLLSNDVQQSLYKILDERVKMNLDDSFAKYVSITGRKLIRSVSKSNLTDFVSWFGEDRKQRFNGLLAEKDILIYGRAISDRHDIAHNQGADVTFEQIQDAINAAKKILAAIRISIGLPVETK